MQSYSDLADPLIRNGFQIVPIRPGGKAPAVAAWTSRDFDAEDFAKIGECGIGIKLGIGSHPLCAIDIDCSHPELAQWAIDVCEQRFSGGLIRLGNAPRAIILLRASESGWHKQSSIGFTWIGHESRKTRETLFSDFRPKPNTQQIEILGKGQQFVAFGIHPDTGKPYEWVDLFGGPIGLEIDQLPIVYKKEIIEFIKSFEEFAANLPDIKSPEADQITFRHNDPSEYDSSLLIGAWDDPVPGIDLAMAATYLPANTDKDYDSWFKIGAALHHQFGGSDEAFALWDSWSQGSIKYEASKTLSSWRSFGKATGQRPVTFRSVLAEFGSKKALELFDARLKAITETDKWLAECNTTSDVLFSAAQKIGKLGVTDAVLATDLRSRLIARHAELKPKGAPKLSDKDAKRAIADKARKNSSDPTRGENPWAEAPEWAQGWTYIKDTNRFYHLPTGRSWDMQAWRAEHDWRLEEVDAYQYVLRTARIPTADYLDYAPGEGEFFKYLGCKIANSYNAQGRCEIPATLSDADEAAINLFRAHIDLLCNGDEREAQIICNFLRICATEPGRKIRWALFLLGDEGIGKSILYLLMARALGEKNTKSISNSMIVSSASTGFNSWAIGHCFGMVEEIKLHGHNRFDALNALKEPITNDLIGYHPKGKEMRLVRNYTNYMLCSNHNNGLPISDGDRRYCVIESRADGTKLLVDSPEYFIRLTKAIEEHTGAIIKWLMGIDFHPDFSPDGRAPMTDAKRSLIAQVGDTDSDMLMALLEDSTSPYYDGDIVCIGKLLSRLASERTLSIGSGEQLAHRLRACGFLKARQIRIPDNGCRDYIWYRKKKFQGEPSLGEIKDWLEKRKEISLSAVSAL